MNPEMTWTVPPCVDLKPGEIDTCRSRNSQSRSNQEHDHRMIAIGLTRGLPGARRAFEPSNLQATSLRYQATMVSGPRCRGPTRENRSQRHPARLRLLCKVQTMTTARQRTAMSRRARPRWRRSRRSGGGCSSKIGSPLSGENRKTFAARRQERQRPRRMKSRISRPSCSSAVLKENTSET